MIEAGVRFLEDWGGSSEFAYPEFVTAFLKATLNGGAALTVGDGSTSLTAFDLNVPRRLAKPCGI